MNVLCIINQKGGVGKTTITITLAHALARKGYRVLVLDLDSQGHVAVALGESPEPGLSHVLGDGAPLADWLREMRHNLFVLPGDKSTANLKERMTGMHFREQKIKQLLGGIDGYHFDLTLIDCAPSLDILSVTAMMAATHLMLPVAMDQLSLEGLAAQVLSLRQLQEMGSNAELAWVVPTFYEDVTNESRRILGELVDHFGKIVAPPIRRDTKVREASSYGLTIWEHAPDSRAAECFTNLLNRVRKDLRMTDA